MEEKALDSCSGTLDFSDGKTNTPAHWKSGSSSSSIIRKSARHSFGASGVHPYRLSPVCNRLHTHTLVETKPIIQTDGKGAIHGRGGRVDPATAGEN
jgi:diadenosine tetraphosphatase ApaH/serine/threonine PP2A family protein phosphatase